MATKLVLLALLIVALTSHTAGAFRITRAVSDLHFASVWFNDSVSHAITRRFFDELAEFGPQEGVTELVLIGDIIELWLDPFNQYPPTVDEVLRFESSFGANVSAYFEQMRNVTAQGIKIVALPGNHDFELTESSLRAVLPDVVWVDRSYISDYARYEHSHYYDLFNAPPPNDRPMRPLGYYVARSVATGAYANGGSPTYTSTVKICQSINLGIFTSPAIKTLSNPTLFGAAIPTLFNTALGFDWSSVKDTPIAGGDPFYDTTKNTTLSAVQDTYDSLVGRFLKVNTSEEILALMKGSCGAFDYFIQNKFSEDLVVMGHTHEPIAEMFFRKGNQSAELGPQIAYINAGAWVTGGSFTYVDTIYDYHPECTHPTRLVSYEYTNNGPIERKFLWLYSPSFDQVLRNTGEVSRNKLKFRCGKPVECPQSGHCDAGLGRANLVTLAMLSAGGVLVEGDARGVSWLGKSYYTTLGNLSISDNRLYYEPENGTTAILFLARWWSDVGSQLGQVVVLPFDPCPIPSDSESTYVGSLSLNPSIGVAVVIGVVGFGLLTSIVFVLYWFAVKPHTTPLP